MLLSSAYDVLYYWHSRGYNLRNNDTLHESWQRLSTRHQALIGDKKKNGDDNFMGIVQHFVAHIEDDCSRSLDTKEKYLVARRTLELGPIEGEDVRPTGSDRLRS